MNIANCAKCNKVFQQLNRSPICPDCAGATQSHAKLVSNFVWEHPGLTVEEVAQQCEITLKDMEEMLFSGRLGSASAYVMFKCQSCHIKMSAQLRKGRFCPDCAGKIESKVSQLEREAASQKDKSQPAKWGGDKKDDHGRSPVEVAGATVDDAPTPKQENKGHPGVSAKQESVSPSSDSYGFKRFTDV